MDFWQGIVEPDTVPTEEPQKSRYNAARLVESAIVQELHAMIQEGLTYSYLTNGLLDVQLWVPYDDPTTLYCDPSTYGMTRGAPMSRIERTLSMCKAHGNGNNLHARACQSRRQLDLLWTERTHLYYIVRPPHRS